MKESPIIFPAPMVRAILEGRKTQTRRVMKPQPKYELRAHKNGWYEYSENPLADPICNSPWGTGRVPKYAVGDILWVRETFTGVPDGSYLYWAAPMNDGCGPGDFAWEWSPAIYMPRKAARLFLEVKSVRVERVQDISEEDARAEGVLPFNMFDQIKFPAGSPLLDRTYKNGFMSLWDTLNAKRGFSWDTNPWVWTISFGRIK
jgi:hypothetical protein